MKIAVLSGKGGTGKTLISTNLAFVVSKENKVQLLDCDVEEPNSHLFLNTDWKTEKDVNLMLPVVNHNICDKNGRCAEECQFGAIVTYPTGTLIFNNLCHGCGVCTMVCPNNAIKEVPKSTGKIKSGKVSENFEFKMGLMNIGEPSGVSIIRELKKGIDNSKIAILDSPPGSTCPVVETLRGVDFALLVTESSPFGLHDLREVLEIIEEMKIPHGVVINRYNKQYSEMDEFLKKKKIPVLLRIPFDRSIAEYYSRGELIVEKMPEKREMMKKLFDNIMELAG